MSRSPAAHLARLKVTYSAWSISSLSKRGYRVVIPPEDGAPERILEALTLDDLERQLWEVRNPRRWGNGEESPVIVAGVVKPSDDHVL